jgi:DNA recombination protein RmuC
LSGEAILLAALLLVVIGLLIALLLRRAPSDPTIPMLQAGQERQATALATMKESLAGDIARQKAELSLELSGFTAEQTKALGAAMLKQTESLAATEKALIERLSAGATTAQEATAAQTTAVSAAMLKQAESLAAMQTALLERLTADAKSTQEAMSAETTRSRDVLDKKLTEMRENSEKRLAEIQKSVNEQLAGAVEKQMNESFQRVIDQFAAIQQMMGNVQSVATQVGDLKRLFGNIKTRGGWGEAQLKAMLDDFLPPGAYETNVKLREDSNDAVEFCILMPGGDDRARLPLDAKFPSEDYDRLMLAHEAGDLVGEAQARRAIEVRVRAEGAKIAQKYICPPRSTDYAILFLPTEGLYAEVARIPGLIEDVARTSKVFIAGPFLLPALLKNIHLGYMSYRLSKSAEGVRDLLSATKTEMAKMEGVFEKLGKQVGNVSNTIGTAQQRTRAIARKLRSLDSIPDTAAEQLLEIEAEIVEMRQDDEEA